MVCRSSAADDGCSVQHKQLKDPTVDRGQPLLCHRPSRNLYLSPASCLLAAQLMRTTRKTPGVCFSAPTLDRLDSSRQSCPGLLRRRWKHTALTSVEWERAISPRPDSCKQASSLVVTLKPCCDPPCAPGTVTAPDHQLLTVSPARNSLSKQRPCAIDIQKEPPAFALRMTFMASCILRTTGFRIVAPHR